MHTQASGCANIERDTMKPLDRNSQIGRLYENMKRYRRFLSTSDVSQYCQGYDESHDWNGPCYCPSTKISQLKERLPAGEQIRRKVKIVKGKVVHYYRLEKIK